jgi:hypothetical protein
MFMLAYLGKTNIIGVPGASLYYKNTILDIVLPRIFIGDILTKRDFVKMGEGGFCSTCSVLRAIKYSNILLSNVYNGHHISIFIILK